MAHQNRTAADQKPIGNARSTSVSSSIANDLRGSTATNGLAGLVIQVVPPISGNMILADTDPLPATMEHVIDIRACAGEYEAASFVVRSLDTKSRQLVLAPSDLTDLTTGATINSSELDIRFVKPWYQSIYGWNEFHQPSPNDFRQMLVPELLLKDDSLILSEADGERNYVRIERGGNQEYILVNPKMLASRRIRPSLDEFPIRDSSELQPALLPGHTNKQVWVTLHVPAQTIPGDYEGRIDIYTDGRLLAGLAVHARVYGFRLANPHITYAIYYRGQLDPQRASIGAEFKTEEQMRSELLDLQRHGISHPTMYQPAANLTQLRSELILREELGINRGPLYYLGVQTTADSLGDLSQAAETNLRRILPRVIDLAQSAGFEEVYVYGQDEAKGDELVKQRELWQIVHDLGGKVFVAGFSGAIELVGDILDTQVNYGNPDYNESARWHASGHKIFSYDNPQAGPENPYIFRLNYGLILWANDYDGAMPFAYQYCFGACWNDVDDPIYRDHNFTYPTANGVIPTLAWEGLREGIDDVRYLTTLEDALAAAQGSDSPEIRAARLFLLNLKHEVRSDQGKHGKYNQGMYLDLDEIRKQVAKHLEAVGSN